MTASDRRAADPGAPVGVRRRRGLAIVAVAVVVLGLTATVFYRWGSGSATQRAPRATPTASATRPPTTAEIYTAVAPSVVFIEAGNLGETDATGTGVVVNGDGTIVTAWHVVQGASSIRTTFADGTTSAAAIAAAAPAVDIAILVPTTLPSIVVPAVLGRADQLSVGDDVVAIGNPLGLTRTTTAGVVSGLNRLAPGPDGVSLSGLIQFDAAVNPGSSGGPLLNAKGETVGIVVALANPTAAGTFIGIGFAVPIAIAVAAGGDRGPLQ